MPDLETTATKQPSGAWRPWSRGWVCWFARCSLSLTDPTAGRDTRGRSSEPRKPRRMPSHRIC